ncbi:MAG: sigma-54 factor interaction domain-containing protein [Pseudomonadota bacterium]
MNRLQDVEKTSVLILGESGTGKELIARAIHFSSARAKNPFIPVNCSAIPEELAESAFFGHVRGAFTGAVNNRKGYFESAQSGTLFLDEMGEMPRSLQAKLLRTLEDGTLMPVGSNQEKKSGCPHSRGNQC